MIGPLFIALGLLSAWLAHKQFKDWQRAKGDFHQQEEYTSDRWWKLNAKLRRFNSHLDLWMFAGLAPLMVAVGVVVMVRGE